MLQVEVADLFLSGLFLENPLNNIHSALLEYFMKEASKTIFLLPEGNNLVIETFGKVFDSRVWSMR